MYLWTILVDADRKPQNSVNYPSIKKIKQQKKVTFMRAHKEDSLGHQPFQDISSLFHLKKKKKAGNSISI